MQDSRMYLHFPVVETVLSHRKSPLTFCDVVNKVIEKYFQIEDIEEKLAADVLSYATDYNLAITTSEYTATFRRYFRILVAAFKKEHQHLKDCNSEEKDMSDELHEGYLKSIAITEVIGHLIMNPTKIKLHQNICVNCDPFFIIVNHLISSSWAGKVVYRIDLPETDKDICYKFGRYNAQSRDFE